MNDIEIAKKFTEEIGREYYTAIQFLELSEETSALKFRQVGELLTYYLLNYFEISFNKESFYLRIKKLAENSILNEDLTDNFHKLRIICNNSIHKYDFCKENSKDNLTNNERTIEKIRYDDIKIIRELMANILRKTYNIVNKGEIKSVLIDKKIIEHSSIPNEALTELDWKKKMNAGLWYEAKAKEFNDKYKDIIPTDYGHQLDYFYKLALVNYEAAYKISVQIDNKILIDLEENEKYKKYSDLEALFKYSLFLSQGYFGESEENKGFELLEFCAKRGHTEALLHCGIFAYNKLQNFDLAYRYLIKAKEFKYSLCYLYLYAYFSNEDIQNKDAKLAFENLMKSYELDNVDAAYFLGEEYFEGNIVEKNIEKSKKYLNEAISKGNFRAKIYYKFNFENLAQEISKKLKSLGKELSKHDINKIISNEKKVNRNEICSCGSGKKYKKCCLKLSNSKYEN